MEENVQKKHFFKELLKSIKCFEKYEDFALEGTKKSLKYITKLILIFCLIISILSTLRIFNAIKELFNDLNDTTVKFSIIDNKLNVESQDTIQIEKYKDLLGVIIINTSDSINEEDLIKQISQDDIGILLLKDKIQLTSNGIKREFKYEDLIKNTNIQVNENNTIEKEDIISLIKSISLPSYMFLILVVVFISNIIIYTIDFISFVLVLTLIAYVIGAISKMKMSFENSFGIAAHAVTLSIVLNLAYLIINTFLEFKIKSFEWMFSSIAYIYVVVAVLMIKTDFIDRQLQLLRISESKEKEEKEQDKQDEEEPPAKEKEKKEKKDKEKNEEEPDSLNGSEA